MPGLWVRVRIYKIANLINGKVYIGQTRHPIETRFDQHCRPRKSAISGAIQKYGVDNFRLSQIGVCDSVEEANIIEGRFIAQYESTNPEKGYNLQERGEAVPIRQFCQKGHDKSVTGSWGLQCKICAQEARKRYAQTAKGRSAEKRANDKNRAKSDYSSRRKIYYAANPEYAEKARTRAKARAEIKKQDPVWCERERQRFAAYRQKQREKKSLL